LESPLARAPLLASFGILSSAMGFAADRRSRLMTPTAVRRQGQGTKPAMPTYFCPGCWAKSKGDQAICPHCGADIRRILASKSYAKRLTDALHHPEPATRLRVAYLLGLRQEVAAVPALAARAAESDDLYVSLQCLTALARIGTREAWEAVASLSSDPRRVVSARAGALLERRPSPEPG
jgi:hypothetical protein